MAQNRPAIPQAIADAVTTKSKRVCALCWALKQDGRAKEGQIAHSNHKNHDHREVNLCWLCLDHHNRFDGALKQTRGVSTNELRTYKAEVEQRVAATLLPTPSHGQPGECEMSAEVEFAFLHDLGNPQRGSLLEIWVQLANRGNRRSSVRKTYVTQAGDHLANLGELGSEPSRHAKYSGEYLHPGAPQFIEGGGVQGYACTFYLEESAAIAMLQAFQDQGSPLELVIEPVLGLPLQTRVLELELNPKGIYPAGEYVPGTLVLCGSS